MDAAPQTNAEPLQAKVSVLIVSQNQIELLRPTLASLAGRLDPEFSEVIVVDCGSVDGSGRIDEQFEGITVLRLPRNFGWTRAVNIATRTAKGEYLFLLPNGVEVAPDTIQALVGAIEADGNVGAVCPAGSIHRLPPKGAGDLGPAAGDGDYPFDHPVLFPKLALVSMNYLPDQYGQFYGDIELFHKLQSAGKRVLVLEGHKLERRRVAATMWDESTAEADKIAGLAAYYSKNHGFLAGMTFWIARALQSLFTFQLGLFFKIVTGTKIDGL